MGITRMEARGVHLMRETSPGGVKVILDALDAAFSVGEIHFVVGPTGAGKTCFLHLLGGLMRPTQGEIIADGSAVSRWTAAHRDSWRKRVGILFQGADLVEDLSVFENVLLPLVPRPGSFSTKAVRVRHVLAELGVLSGANQVAQDLSGGERQRVALARAIVSDPDLLLLDEPSAHQDDDNVGLILAVMNRARAKGSIVIVASHDPRILQSGVASSTCLLASGRILSSC
jgi:putative ABC transport system ATP-binding protein